MPLIKLTFKPGVNREVTRYANEAGWYESDKVRFSEGLPEKIGGWRRISANRFLGICRSLNQWATIAGTPIVGVGTHLKFYIESGAQYFDITPIRLTSSAGDVTFTAVDGATLLTVIDADHGAKVNDFVTFSGADSLGGNVTAGVLNKEYQITNIVSDGTYQVILNIPATSSDSGDGGTATIGAYQENTGSEIVTAITGWGAGAWSAGTWSNGVSSLEAIRIWNQTNFGEDLVYGPVGGGLFYWDATTGFTTRGTAVSSLPDASDVPTVQNYMLSSDVFRFLFCFGTNLLGSNVIDPMLIRWSDQEDVTMWTPEPTNQAGSIRLSIGAEIVTAIQARQEVLVWTDAALYSLQYVGTPAVWGVTLVGNNTSIASRMSRTFANGVCYWMGKDGFYQYDGRVQSLRCDLKRFVFDDINRQQYEQVFASTVEAFNEVWFFYCSKNSTVCDRYVIFNYVEGIWAYGSLRRSAWIDSGLNDYPIAATYSNNLVEHENGVDDNETNVMLPIKAFIQSGEFDLEDGDRVMFVWRCLPDMNFSGSTSTDPSVDMTFLPRYSSGAPYNDPLSEGGLSSQSVTRTTTVPVEQYTAQIDIRVRGRQMAIRIESEELGNRWQFGTPRIEMRQDGRR